MKSATELQIVSFKAGLLCLRQFVVRSKKENVATKYAKYFEMTVCMTINDNFLVLTKPNTSMITVLFYIVTMLKYCLFGVL